MARSKIRSVKLTASSILEVVVSMVVIVMVLGIAMMIYTNVMRLSLSERRLRAQVRLQQAMLELEHPLSYGAKEDNNEDWTIEKDILPYEGNARLQEVHLVLYDERHEKISEIRKIVINNEDK
ncbi:hypothetical protein KHS38_00025 [Mucilaginibacter sp. Bleaf8]|uniref:hypothetical protein n=1 Tax=Mucilaginibacter sp. Bleaf8 TaxID=2834430 RepID=UPI001BCE425B|nr:hypothetical protein [Mucilaginibacter sp. Bleaf8]MBS7562777.1 hypothetical protein [Mucilaginibacter sp. Bleaf8]